MSAVAAFEALVNTAPSDASAWFRLGAARHQQGLVDEARQAFFEAARLDASHLQARLALASVCLQVGDTCAAMDACHDALRIAIGDPSVWFSLGVAQEAAGLKDQALQSYERALAIDPGHVDALNNRGTLLISLGYAWAAVENNQLLARRQPYSTQAQFNLGESLIAAKDYPGAVRAFRKSLRLSPENARVCLHAAFALAQCEQFKEAQQLLDRATFIDQEMVKAYRRSIFREDGGSSLDARTLFLLRHYDAIECCDWSGRDDFLRLFSALINENAFVPLHDKALGFRAMAMGLPSQDQLQLARGIASAELSDVCAVERLSSSLPELASADADSRRIRVGYLSPDFRAHPAGMLARDMFAWHDRARFEVVAYSLSADDGSDVARRIREGCDSFSDVSTLSDMEVAQRIATDRIDIMIDLCGYADRSRPGILARRPAPLQVSWLAYMGTMGAPWIDYLVGDPVVLPTGCDEDYSEALIRLPAGLFLCSYARSAVSAAPERSALGLPEDGVVLGAMHNAYKIDPEVFGVWMRVLTSSPNAVLWLLSPGREGEQNLRCAAKGAGVDPVRLIFAPKVAHALHIARLQQADLMMDTPQCNGGTTTADALVAGVPVLSVLGTTFAQRMAASLLIAAGQQSMVANSLAEYESLALELLSDSTALADAKASVASARGRAVFFRPEIWLKSFESALEVAWGRHCQNLRPATFEVPA